MHWSRPQLRLNLGFKYAKVLTSSVSSPLLPRWFLLALRESSSKAVHSHQVASRRHWSQLSTALERLVDRRQLVKPVRLLTDTCTWSRAKMWHWNKLVNLIILYYKPWQNHNMKYLLLFQCRSAHTRTQLCALPNLSETVTITWHFLNCCMFALNPAI